MRKTVNKKIIALHDIFPTSRMGINTFSPKKLKELLIGLKEKYNILTVSNLLKQTDNHKNIAITFDDGYSSIYNFALPIFKELNITASVMIIAGFTGKKNLWDPSPLSRQIHHLSLEQIKEISNAGWEIAPHGFYHFAYTKLNKKIISKDIEFTLEFFKKNELKIPNFLSLPFGLVDEYSASILNNNFKYLLGMINFGYNNNAIQRYPIYSNSPVSKIISDIQLWPNLHFNKRFYLSLIHSGAHLSAIWQKVFHQNKIHNLIRNK